MTTKVLVTGATGFVGRHLVRHLADDSACEVIALSRRDTSMPAGVTMQSIADASPHDLDAWTAIVAQARPDAIVHLAAAGVSPDQRDALQLVATNTVWPATLLAAASACGVKVAIIAGSSAEYARSRADTPLAENAPLESDRLYGASKAAGGLLALSVAASLGMRVAVLRLFNVYGSGEAPHRLVPSIADAARDLRPIALSAGTQVRDFVAIDDACDAIAIALAGLTRGDLARGAYNVCSGIGTSVATFASTAVHALGADPALLRFGALPMRPDDLPWLVGDPTRFTSATGWRPRLDLAAGVARALDIAPTQPPSTSHAMEARA